MSYEADAREHMRKEDFDEVVGVLQTSNNKNRSRLSGEPIDYYEYYPVCIRRCLPKQRTGNMIAVYESPSGKCVVTIGPHWPGTLVVFFMLLGGASMDFHRVGNSAMLQTLVPVFLCLSLVFLFLTACTDPGIVRTSVVQPDEEAADGLVYCEVCSIYKVPTTVHCQDCNCCIEEMDHHCPWMSKCIGKKNMKWFILFNLTWLSFFVQFIFALIGNANQ